MGFLDYFAGLGYLGDDLDGGGHAFHAHAFHGVGDVDAFDAEVAEAGLAEGGLDDVVER